MDWDESNAQDRLNGLRNSADIMRRALEEVPPPADITNEELNESIENEIKKGTIILDKDGFPPGAKLVIFSRVREYMQRCADAKRAFLDRFQPFETQISELRQVEASISELEASRSARIYAERQKMEADPIKEEYNRARSTYQRQRDEHKSLPNLKAINTYFPFDVNPTYFAIMAFLGVAEWFINYDTLFLFFGIPVIAMGATVILAVCLSIIAHQHGLDLRQWKKKFGPAVPAHNKPYGILILATFGLILLLVVTGWMRYQAVMGVLKTQTTANILGTQYSVRIDLEREVIISLGANLLAWLVGVFVSYFVHDPDPVYVATAIDEAKARRRFAKLDKSFQKSVVQISSELEQQIEGQKNRLTKLQTDPYLQEAINMKEQVLQNEEGFKDRAKTFIITQYSRYRSELLRHISKSEELQFFNSSADGIVPISANEFKTIEMGVNNETLERITSNNSY